MRERALDAMMATLPEHVLLLTGYELAENGYADRIVWFSPSGLDRITAAAEAVCDPLRDLIRDQRLDCAVFGVESGEYYPPASYASIHFYGDAIGCVCLELVLRPTIYFLGFLRATLTAAEIERVRHSCRLAATAFDEGRRQVVAGMTETSAAARLHYALASSTGAFPEIQRAHSYFHCTSGARSAEAFGAEFKHSNGHGVRFRAIDHNAPPRLHPASDDRLETGRVYHLEPAVYIEGFSGVRGCDMVAVTGRGSEVLTPFSTSFEGAIP